MPENTALALPDEGAFRDGLQAIRRFQAVAKTQMVSGHDYGVIPGTQKPTLLKPGAEKITKLLGLADEYLIIEQSVDWKQPFFHFLVKAQLRALSTGLIVSEGLGECNSMEARYRWRWVFESALPAGTDKTTLQRKQVTARGAKAYTYRVENDDIYSQVNTVLKMAKKRALVDAALSAGRLSDVFTQDMEDRPAEAAPDPDDVLAESAAVAWDSLKSASLDASQGSGKPTAAPSVQSGTPGPEKLASGPVDKTAPKIEGTPGVKPTEDERAEFGKLMGSHSAQDQTRIAARFTQRCSTPMNQGQMQWAIARLKEWKEAGKVPDW